MELLEIAKLPTAENSAVHLNPLDNVAIARVPLSAGMKLLIDGVPVAVLEGKELRFLVEMSAADQWQARNSLLRRNVPAKVRTYLNDSGRAVSPQTISSLTH